MHHLTRTLAKSPLFLDMPPAEILSCLSSIPYAMASYGKGDLVALEGDPCFRVGIVVSGHLEVQKIYPSGKAVTLTHLRSGGMFGEIIVFSGVDRYPATLHAIEPTQILFIEKTALYALMEKFPAIMRQFMRLLTRKILMLNARIKNLSYHTIREKIAGFLLESCKETPSAYVDVGLTRQEMAELFNIPRPSLSRELAKMRQEGLIDFDRSVFRIKDMQKLEDLLF